MRSSASTTTGSRRMARRSPSTVHPSAPSSRIHCSCNRSARRRSTRRRRLLCGPVRRARRTRCPRWRDADAQNATAERHLEIPPERSLTVADGLGHDRGHARVAFEASHLDRLGPLDRHVGHERRGRGQVGAGLAQRRQHLLDVAEEEAVRPDHEHALALERVPVGVQEVRGAMERDRGLAGTRAALHDEHAGEWRADDLVLLGLNRGDDVAR